MQQIEKNTKLLVSIEWTARDSLRTLGRFILSKVTLNRCKSLVP